MEIYTPALLNAWAPDPQVTIDQFADEDRYLSSSTSAEPGRWDTNRTPYLRKMMQELSPLSPVRKVSFMKSVQVGGTEVPINGLGFHIKHAPTSIIVVLPTDESAKNWSKTRIDSLISESPALMEIMKGRHNGSDSMFQKDYPGGTIRIASAASPASLKSSPCEIAYIDEADEFPIVVGTQGCPIGLVEARQRTFPGAKTYIVSSPTDLKTSRIYREFMAGNQQHYYMPCPSCKFYQTIDWEDIKYTDKDPSTARWECRECGKQHGEEVKMPALLAGEWRAHAPENGEEHQSYHINTFYSPFFSWAKCVELWLRALDTPRLLPIFTNTVRGLPTKTEVIEAPEWITLFDRRESYQEGTVPEPVQVLTAGIDVQGDRLEAEVIGWREGLENWSIIYEVINGAPYDPNTWDELERFLSQTFIGEDGLQYNISMACIDTGYQTAEVYNFLRRYPVGSNVVGIKGGNGHEIISQRPTYVDFSHGGKPYKKGASVRAVGSGKIKEQIYGQLALEYHVDEQDGTVFYPPGYCHFPEYDPEYFEMLTAEYQEARRSKTTGIVTRQWVKSRDRNESLDTRVYARAALELLGISRWQPAHWEAQKFKNRPVVTAQQVKTGGYTRPKLPPSTWVR